MQIVKKRIIISGNIIEYVEYEKPYFKDYKRPEKTKNADMTKEKNTMADNRQIALNRAKNEIRRLINSNYDILDKFITLTFEKNEKDLDYCNYEFKKFMQRLKYQYGNIEYIVVVEFQKRGAVHYHMLCNLGYVRNSTLREIWGNGFIKINRIDKVDNLGAYVVKYMHKDISDKRLNRRKSYFRSKGLKVPIEYTKEKEVIALADALLQDLEPVYTNSYKSEYTGITSYSQYNLISKKVLVCT